MFATDRYEDQYIIQFFTEKLLSMPCQNQGFVLDGFPKTYSQAKELFGNKEEPEDEDAPRLEFDSKIMPGTILFTSKLVISVAIESTYYLNVYAY